MDYEQLTPLVKKAAQVAGSSFPSHHDSGDTEQAVWLWVVENEGAVEELTSNLERPEKTLLDLMVKVAHSYLKGEDAAVYHYSEEDAFYYSKNLIKEILEVVFQHEDWISFATALDAMPKGKVDPSHAGNNLASYADVKSAVEHLSEDHYNVIIWRYKYKHTFEAIGAELGITRQAAQQRHETALSACQRFLGKKDLNEVRNPPERPVRPSGQSARARVEHDYEG